MKLRVKNFAECNIGKKASMKLWHERFGQINCRSIKKAVDRKMVENLEIDGNDEFFCESCQFGKQA